MVPAVMIQCMAVCIPHYLATSHSPPKQLSRATLAPHTYISLALTLTHNHNHTHHTHPSLSQSHSPSLTHTQTFFSERHNTHVSTHSLLQRCTREASDSAAAREALEAALQAAREELTGLQQEHMLMEEEYWVGAWLGQGSVVIA